jgi:hypothetical protein
LDFWKEGYGDKMEQARYSQIPTLELFYRDIYRLHPDAENVTHTVEMAEGSRHRLKLTLVNPTRYHETYTLFITCKEGAEKTMEILRRITPPQ